MKETMWIIVDKNGSMFPMSLTYTAKESKRYWLEGATDKWSNWTKRGWRCRKVTVQIELTDKK